MLVGIIVRLETRWHGLIEASMRYRAVCIASAAITAEVGRSEVEVA